MIKLAWQIAITTAVNALSLKDRTDNLQRQINEIRLERTK